MERSLKHGRCNMTFLGHTANAQKDTARINHANNNKPSRSNVVAGKSIMRLRIEQKL
jgi:hypothetical protein